MDTLCPRSLERYRVRQGSDLVLRALLAAAVPTIASHLHRGEASLARELCCICGLK